MSYMMSPPALHIIRRPDPAASLLDETRQLLLTQLAQPDSAAGLARRLGLPRQRINYHLKVMESQGLVELVEERRKGNCVERVVRASARSFMISPEALGALGDSPEAARDRYSSAYLIATAGRTIRELALLQARARETGKSLATLTIDSEIRFATAAARSAFAEELADAVAQLAAKYHTEHAPGGRRFRVLAAVHPAPHAGASSGTDEN